MFEISDELNREEVQSAIAMGAKIKVIGVGGAGCNAVNTMIKAGLTGVEYIVANTDSQSLAASLASVKIQLGSEITKGLGAGANPEVGKKAALEDYEKIGEVIENSDMIFVTAGMGGGTGTGAAPVIAKLAKELGALTVGVVTKPFFFEGKKRMRIANAGISVFEDNVDSLITIPNQRLLYLAGDNMSLVDTFMKADEVLLNAVRGISDLINNTGHINADFADVSTVMANKGLSLMGTGVATGPDRSIKAATEAISSPLLEDISIDGATGIIINISGNSTLTMHETNEAVTLIMEAADEDAEIIFGTVIDEDLEDNIKVTVIATGLGGKEKVSHKEIRAQKEMAERLAAPEVEVVQTVERVRYTPVTAGAMNEESARTMYNMVEETNKISDSLSQSMEKEVNGQFENMRSEFQSPNKSSNLVDNIKSAAQSYETQKREEKVATQKELEPVQETPAPRQEVKSTVEKNLRPSKARSIAEKLGFLDFDEEFLDTPTFLRKKDDETQEETPVRPDRL
jgi:cell division protein FtsZ